MLGVFYYHIKNFPQKWGRLSLCTLDFCTFFEYTYTLDRDGGDQDIGLREGLKISKRLKTYCTKNLANWMRISRTWTIRRTSIKTD
jgi:hypothetical protein